MTRLALPLLLASCACGAAAGTYRVLVTTDLGGDPDDIQSLYRLVHYSDILKVEGIVSSPGLSGRQDAAQIPVWLRRIDVEHLRRRGHADLMREEDLMRAIKRGAAKPGAPAPARATEGSRWIVSRAREGEGVLWVLVWGAMTDVAQALHDDPGIAGRIRIYSIGSANTEADPASRDFVFEGMANGRWPGLWWIENGIMPRRSHDTFFGVHQGGEQAGEWGNVEFIARNIRGRGSTHGGEFRELSGDAFPLARFQGLDSRVQTGILKEGDSPSMLFLLSPVLGGTGDIDDPTRESWGGQFRYFDRARFPNYYVDLDAAPEQCWATINKWRKGFLADWKQRWAWYGNSTGRAFRDRLLPAPPGGGFRMDGYWVWCGSVVRGEDGLYHMFASRWPAALSFDPHWLTNSEVVRATASRPEGPYRFEEVVLPARGARFWDGRMTHNPVILRHKGTYLLFYTGTTYDGPTPKPASPITDEHPMRAQARANQRIGIATAKSIRGPWKRMDRPVLEPRPGKWDALMVTNPAPCVREDGRVLLVYKSTAHQEDLLRLGVARTGNYLGRYERASDEEIFRFGSAGDHIEDAFVWHDGTRFRLLMKDMEGGIGGEVGGGLQATSVDGVKWALASPPQAYSRTILFEDGTRKAFRRAERPFVLLENGRPWMLFLAVAEGPNEGPLVRTWNQAIPLEADPHDP